VIQVYNTLTRKKEVLVPRREGELGLYVCGPTVYDRPHIGHARTYVAFDVIQRYLRSRGYRVTYVQNITDIDDKIIQRARERGESPSDLAARYEEAYFREMEALKVQRADRHPRVTEHIPEIVAAIEALLERGVAYEAGGDVYFSVEKVPGYGGLSRQVTEEMMAGARVGENPLKRGPLDFALWKRAKPGEPSWKSPWGPGRPGWHIECSVMAIRYLGEQLDIHGGGLDLVFPHHENEISQSEALTGKRPFVRYWLHTGFVRVEGKKMSKSLGNFIAVEELLSRYPPEALRFFFLSTHYRSPIDYREENLAALTKNLEKLCRAIEAVQNAGEVEPDEREKELESLLQKAKEDFVSAMDDDFNAPLAISILNEFVRDIYRYLNSYPLTKKIKTDVLNFFIYVDNIFSIFKFNYIPIYNIKDKIIDLFGELNMYLENVRKMDTDTLLDELLSMRSELRRKREYKKADQIRDRLGELGVIVEDREEGSVWRYRTLGSTASAS
jgi:cysteinyl-tRNA synthetase